MKLPKFEQNSKDQGSISQREPEYIIWISLLMALEVKSYVELGSTFASVNFVKRMGVGKVVSVDIAHNPAEELCQGIRYFSASSYDPQTLENVLSYLGKPPDAVFIDADHDGDAPRKDFELWWPHTQKVLGFHDILIPNIANDLWKDVSLRIHSAKIIGCDLASAVSWQGTGTPSDGIISGGGIGVLFKERA